ncbi:shikimate dehydrogenase [Actinokineospora globicatena]|uniref:Shikimate dehydrogenase n=1 Tax=Actinokineospora globicatena TaxID=103729 RepID=A0A9W6QQ04_9PSEU|nr:shikimate dehydrogenase [Actinokineospora globicatena]GLW94418.1 shikimate dehydrogenase [Actinokineospora globicatena]
MRPTDVRRAAVLGSPVAHSLSPVLHGAAFEALDLPWTYDRVECDEAGLPALVSSLGDDWIGLSVTMPGKRAALSYASTATPRAVAVGAANTLVRADGGWLADCTDVDGVTGALRAADFSGGSLGVVFGAGGTACAALAAFVDLGITSAVVVVREPSRAAEAVDCAARLGLPLEVFRWSDTDFSALAASCAVLVNTVPPAATEPLVASLASTRHLLDVIYHPWPTPLATAVSEAGGTVTTGLDMLLHQAFGQVVHFTGQSAPRAAMRSALVAATGGVHALPI